MCAKPKLLLVEDEPMVRFIGYDALVEAGYDVIEAASAEEALEAVATVGEVEVLFTDIRMPGRINGLELAALLHQRWPAMKILLTSGDTWPTKDRIPDDGRFLAKPYNVSALQREVEHLFDR